MADESNKIEKEALSRAVDPWKEQVHSLREAVFMLYTPFMGGEVPADQAILIATRIIQMLDELNVDPMIDSIILQAINEAHKAGMDIARRGSDADILPNVAVDAASIRAVVGMAARAEDAITQAKVKLTGVSSTSTLEGLMSALKPVVDSPTQMQRATTWSVNNAKNSAITKVALETGETLTWISERDGCVHCLAYSGEVARPNGQFPRGLTFGQKPLENKGFLSCPLHPNCRCDLEIGISTEYRDALKRESIRSVLRGYKLPSESERVRIEAAARLLEKDPVAPASVKKYAKTKIKNFNKEHPPRKKAK